MRRTLKSVEDYIQGIRSGDRVILGQAITLVESTRAEHTALAQEVIARLLQEKDTTNATFRIAITGAPGVGKSTFIEALGMYLIQQGHRVAVLAIDPSSAVSKGSILGDKTRMEQLSVQENAFIRPSPAGTSLGGVARKTREALLLVEAAGYDIILIETVGVGQSEIAAQRMTDCFVLLLLPGAGDELQGIKRGIVEMADLIFVNKADAERVQSANQARAQYANATHLLPPKPNGQAVQIMAGSAVEQKGIAEAWAFLDSWHKAVRDNGFLEQNRSDQAGYWMQEAVESGLRDWFFEKPAIQAQLKSLNEAVLKGDISSFAAAETLLLYLKNSLNQ